MKCLSIHHTSCTRATRGMVWPPGPPSPSSCPLVAPASKRATPGLQTRHSLTKPAPRHSPSPRSRRRAAGAQLRAARPPRHAAAEDHPRRRLRCPEAAQTLLRRPPPSPPTLPAGRCLPDRSLSLPVLCPVGLRKTAVSRRSVDQRPRFVPACF